MEPNEVINEERTKINELDTQIIGLLNQRMESVRLIGKAKKQLNLPITDKNREKEVIEKLKTLERCEGLAEAVYPAIMAFAKTLE